MDEEMSYSPFLMVDKRLLKAREWVSPSTGEVFPLSLVEMVVYSFMRDRWLYFTQQGGKYYETQDQIAEACATYRKKVNAIVGRWIKEGVVEAHKVKVDTGVSLVYDVVHPLLVKDVSGETFSVGRKNI